MMSWAKVRLPVKMLVVCIAVLLSQSGQVFAQSNLLANPSFEEGTYVYNNDGDQRVPNGWLPWWSSPVTNQCYNGKPHYELEGHPPHVRDGSLAARYYTSYQSHNGGLMQQVNATPGTTYNFSIYGLAWSTNNPVVNTPSTTYSKLWVGIDPTGGTDGNASSVVWSAEAAQMDSYGLFTVQAKATSNKVTVFTRTRPDWCVARNDSFWDAATLTTTTGTTPAQPPTSPSPGGVSATANITLNVRSGPGIENPIIGFIPVGAVATVTGRAANSQWIYVNYNGVTGWVAGWLCTISGDLNSVPVLNSSSAPAPSPAPAAPNSVIATANISINVRGGPGTTFNVVGVFTGGSSTAVLGRNADSTWLFVDVNGVKGWVAAWLCTVVGDLTTVPVTGDTAPSAPPPPAPAAPQPTGVTATPASTLNMRSGPGTSFAVVGALPGGAVASVIGRSNDSSWLQVIYNGLQGWVAGWLCTVSGDLNSVPVTGQSTTTQPSAPPSSPAGGGTFALGGQVPQAINHGDIMRSAKMTWAKFQVAWSPGMSPDSAAGYINLAHSNGFKVLLSITGPLYPDNIDYGSYVEFVRGVAGLGPDAIEVWNEQNLARQWPAGTVNPASFVNDVLKPSYQAIKSVNPGVMVISGAPAPTGAHDGSTVWADDAYLVGMRDSGAGSYMDCLGIHYNAGATSPDASVGHPADGGGQHYSWYFKPTMNLYTSVFPSKPLCFTEMGYMSPEGYGYTPPAFWWGAGTTVFEQAEWLSRAVSLARSSGKVRLVIVFNVDFTHYSDDPQAGYAILRPDGSCPACAKLSAALP